ncbi:MAG: hypothetical protein MUC49_09410 [Raineya sp.]|jgi:hypothetical protein|nr:hypothetical protein [Raineya sp.]
MNIQDLLKDVKLRSSSFSDSLQHFGQVLAQKCQNFISDPSNVITHFYAPRGSYENAMKLKKLFFDKFGFEAPSELLSFYEMFDGLEIRCLTQEEIMDILERNSYVKKVLMDENKNLLSMSLKEIQKIDNPDLHDEIASDLEISDFYDLETPYPRISNPSDTYYYPDSISNEVGIVLIPSMEHLFSDKNRPYDYNESPDLYYFNYFTDFNQMMIGIENNDFNLYQVKYGYGELYKIPESFKEYLETCLIPE